MDKIGVYPGTFDPMTNGHIDIVKRSLKIVDKLIISVADNVNKIALLSIEERKSIINNDIRKNNIEIVNIENFEEGAFPRKLSRVTLKKL